MERGESPGWKEENPIFASPLWIDTSLHLRFHSLCGCPFRLFFFSSTRNDLPISLILPYNP